LPDATASPALSRPAFDRLPTAAWIAAGAILIAGAALRIAGAQGELWLDEIWSLRLIDQIKAGNLLPAIATDNNHYLNTLYLALVGGDAEPRMLRALSILLGTATVAAAGWLQRERGWFTAIATMALIACAYPLVNAGSEARGYAGMLLCALLAIAAAERARDQPSRRNDLMLGIAAVVGVLFQPLMLALIAGLGVWIAWQGARAGGGAREVIMTVRDRFVWTVRLLIPVIAVVGIAVYFGRQGYSLGGVTPFAPRMMADGIAMLFRFMLGLPDAVPANLVLALVLAVIVLAVLLRRKGDRRLALYLIVIFGMPAAMALARLPNTEMPRYYILPGMIFLLLLADLLGNIWSRGIVLRGVALIVLLAILVGNGLALQTFLQVGRGGATAMLNRIVAEGPGPITSNTERRDGPVLSYFLKHMKIDQPFVAYHDVCKTPPRWILTSDPGQNLPDSVVIGDPDCRRVFHQVAHYTPWGLSGMPWTLYRAE
jgi:hypothetical protein